MPFLDAYSTGQDPRQRRYPGLPPGATPSGVARPATYAQPRESAPALAYPGQETEGGQGDQFRGEFQSMPMQRFGKAVDSMLNNPETPDSSQPENMDSIDSNSQFMKQPNFPSGIPGSGAGTPIPKLDAYAVRNQTNKYRY